MNFRILAALLAAVLLMAICAGCGGQALAEGETAVTFFNADKADAIVIRSGNAVIVVDAGLEENGSELVSDLKKLGVDHIDVLIVTHFDRDHVGGAAKLLQSFPVDTVYQSNSPKDSNEYESYLAALAETGLTPVTVREPVTFTAGSASFSIDPPAQEVYEVDPSNNSSLIVTLTANGCTVLLAGDAEKQRMQEFEEGYVRPSGSLILKVPYHGNWQKELKTFLPLVQPDAAILCCSTKEPEEKDRLKTEALLEELGSAVYRTFEGDITLHISGDGYTIEQ